MLGMADSSTEKHRLWQIFRGQSFGSGTYDKGPPEAITMVPRGNYAIHLDPAATKTPEQAERSKTFLMMDCKEVGEGDHGWINKVDSRMASLGLMSLCDFMEMLVNHAAFYNG